MNYQRYLTQASPVLPSRQHHQRGAQHQCPSCMHWVQAVLLLDVSGLPSAVTGGAAWACSGCWSAWVRERRQMASGDEYLVQTEALSRFFELTGNQRDHLVPIVRAQLERLKQDLDQRIAARPQSEKVPEWQATRTAAVEHIGRLQP